MTCMSVRRSLRDILILTVCDNRTKRTMPEVTKSNKTKGSKPGAVAALTSTTRLAPATAATMSTTKTSSSAAVSLKFFRVNANCIARPCRGIPLERIRGAAKAAVYRRVAVAKGWNVVQEFRVDN